MATFDYRLLLLHLLPETVIVLGALIILFCDQTAARRWPLKVRSTLAAAAGGLTLLAAVLSIRAQGEGAEIFAGVLHLTAFNQWVRIFLCLLGIATLLIAKPGDFTPHIGEFIALLLMSTVGLLLLVSAVELLTAFIALELTSLSLYLLAGFNKASRLSAEAALKYFLFGGVAAAFTLYGISLIYGLAGSTNFAEIAANLRTRPATPLMIAALVLTAIGFAFKMAAAPLHFWAPDAYQGAPVPGAAWIASGSKLASFILFSNLFNQALPAQAGSASAGSAAPGWAVAIAAIAAVSILAGNLLAIAQTNFRRLLAYSAVAHAGYVLIAVLAGNELGAASAVYYLFTYGLAVIGLFGIVGALECRHGEMSIRDLAGLSRRAPLLALCLFVFVLSLAGIPPLAGFFGKFYVFLGAVAASKTGAAPGLLWIVILALAASCVSLFYYLEVLKQAFVAEPAEPRVITAPFSTILTLILLAGAVLYLGCFPETLNRPLQNALIPRSLIQASP